MARTVSFLLGIIALLSLVICALLLIVFNRDGSVGKCASSSSSSDESQHPPMTINSTASVGNGTTAPPSPTASAHYTLTEKQCSNFYYQVCSTHVEEQRPRVYSEIEKLSAALGNHSVQTSDEVRPSVILAPRKKLANSWAFRSRQSRRRVCSTGSVLQSSPTGTTDFRDIMRSWLSRTQCGLTWKLQLAGTCRTVRLASPLSWQLVPPFSLRRWDYSVYFQSTPF